mgnify:CR=1 FL=1
MKTKKIDPFTSEKKSIGDFFILLAIVFATCSLTDIVTQLVIGKAASLDWSHIAFTSLLLLPTTIAYFVARLLAYKTKFMSKTENRQGIHLLCFLILMCISISLTVAFA